MESGAYAGHSLATTLILMAPTASLRGLRLATTLILMVAALPKLARLVPDGSQAPGAVGASANGALVNEVVIDEFLSAVRTSQAFEPSPALLLEQIRSSPVFLRSLESPGLFEICAGRGTLSDAYDAEDITPRLLSGGVLLAAEAQPRRHCHRH